MLPFLEKLPSPLANFVPDGQRSSPLISVSLQNISLHIKQDHSGTSLILKTDLKTSICADKISCASFRSTETVLFSGGVLCANECASIQLKVFSLQKLPAARSPCSVLPVMPPPPKERSCPLPMGSCSTPAVGNTSAREVGHESHLEYLLNHLPPSCT